MLKIYHGSQQIIDSPLLSLGNAHNDFGQGFYCTGSLDLAGEWSCYRKQNGYINHYQLNTNGLQILDLTNRNYNILNWLAVLIQHRIFDLNLSVTEQALTYLSKHFLPNLNNYDLIIGYRADDSYFSFVENFLNNTISLRELLLVFKMDSDNQQIALKTQKAIQQLTFADSTIADYRTHYYHRCQRDEKLRLQFTKRDKTLKYDDLFILEMVRKEIAHDHPRLQSNLFE